MEDKVREPKQSRSIEKKNRIIEAGYKLFSEVGYYGTNTAEIAKRAGVSTGIVYGYFQDKRDIMISVLKIYTDKVFEPLFDIIDKLKAPVDFNTLIPKVMDFAIKAHKNNTKIHEALHSLSSSDEAVGAKFISLEDEITLNIKQKLEDLKVKIDNPLEKIHFAMDIIQSFAHEYAFDKHAYIDYDVMRKMVTDTLIALFSQI